MSVDHRILSHSLTLSCSAVITSYSARSVQIKTDERICVTSIPQGSSVRPDDLISSTTLFDRIHDQCSEEETPSVLIA